MTLKYVKIGRISDNELAKIEKEKNKYSENAQNSQITNGDGGYTDENIRKSLVYFPDIYECKRTINILQSIIIQELSKYNIDTSNISEVQYVRYENGGKFNWHSDVLPTTRSDLRFRGITFSINITSPDEYDGGELKLHDGEYITQLPKEKGSYIIFPSYMRHQVFEITNGIREAIVLWVYLTEEEMMSLKNETA